MNCVHLNDQNKKRETAAVRLLPPASKQLPLFCCSCVSGPNGSAATCLCVAGYEGNGTSCKGKTHSTQPDATWEQLSELLVGVKWSEFDSMAFICQKWTCAAGLMEDVQKTLCALRSQQEKGPAPAERGILEMESYAWVCCPKPPPINTGCTGTFKTGKGDLRISFRLHSIGIYEEMSNPLCFCNNEQWAQSMILL